MSPQSTSSHAPKRAHPRVVRFDGSGILDAHGTFAAPGSLLVEFADPAGSIFPARVLAVGRPAEVDAHEAGRAPALRTISRPNAVLIPGLVNAHTHLDLTHIGPQPHDPAAGFVPWVEMIRDRRLVDPGEIARSVARGVELSLAAGVVAVGDIAGAILGKPSLAAHDALVASRMVGVSFVEFFAIGTREVAGLGALAAVIAQAERRGLLDRSPARVRLGFQPHSPYSVGPAAYLASARLIDGRGQMCTHLAETPEERMLVTQARGPLRRMLEGLGLWNQELESVFGQARTPVEHVRDCALHRVPLFAHVNDASDHDIALLHRAGAAVAYCPRASAYFGAERHFAAHRYRDMLTAGIPVALGTDSVVNLPPEAGELPSESPSGRGMSIFDEMRFLHQRDGTSGLELLRMGTTSGARALFLESDAFRFAPGHALAGLVAVPHSVSEDNPQAEADRIMKDCTIPELLFASIFSDSTEQSGR